MRRRFPILGVILILIGAAGLMWLSSLPRPLPRFGRGPGPWGGRLFMGPGMMGGWWSGSYAKKSFASNGERIYYTGISDRDGPILRAGGPPWAQQPGVGCVACHGVSGRGGVPVMMGTALPANIRYEALIKGEYEHGKKGTPYSDPLIRRAITEGLDPNGQPLDWTMPRWQMSGQDLNDLGAYLKTLP